MLLSLRLYGVLVALSVFCATAPVRADEHDASAANNGGVAPKKIVFLAGSLDAGHPKGTHEYERTLEALQDMLENSPLGDQLYIELHYEGWPRDERTLDDADAIVLFSNGGDRKEEEHPLLVGTRWEVLRRQMQRGCGLALLHWSTFLPSRHQEEALEWVGGFFDYQGGPPPRNWYSSIQHATVKVQPGSGEHPITSGMKPFELTDEYYYRIRFRENDPRLRPVLVAPIPGEAEPQVVAWAVEREDGGRGFAYTGCHYLNSLELPQFRRMMLNSIAWTAKLPIPPEGLSGDARRPIKAIIVTGHQYPGHLWRETTLALEDALKEDARFEIDSIPDPEFLASPRLHEYDVVLFNYCNWEQPQGLSAEGKANFVRYLEQGGGLVIIHFTNGAFHFSLPKAGESDWPEWRTKICRRVWDHTPGKSGHDAYGAMRVDIADPQHPITKRMEAFETVDELYYRQQGEEPIHVVATARSKDTGNDEPMAFVYSYGAGRVFQTVLGHAAESLRTEGAAELVRRGSAWAAGRLPKSTGQARPSGGVALAEGRFGRALDARRGGLACEHRPAYDTFPLTVECWVQAYSKDNFNIFLAKNPKSSPQHWELYSYVQTGELSVYLPGYEPAEIKSGVPVTDGQWHHVAMTCDGRRVRLYVDGKLARQEFIKKVKEGDERGPLWIGAYPPDAIGCQGLVDEVRLSNRVREIEGLPTAAPVLDDSTVGLWHLDEAEGISSADDSPAANPARVISSAAIITADNDPDHFDGFQEEHVVDDRWREMDTGPFLSTSIGMPSGPTWKGLIVRVGERRDVSLCYDTELLRVSGAWSGFLQFSPARFGLIEMPKPAAKPWFEAERRPGWAREGSFEDPRPRAPYGTLPRTWARYEGLQLHGPRVLVKYQVGSVTVRESPWLETISGKRFVTRTLEIAPADKPLLMDTGSPYVGLQSAAGVARLVARDGQSMLLEVAPRDTPLRLKLLIAEEKLSPQQIAAAAAGSPPAENLELLAQAGPPRWGTPLVTRGERAADDQAYVVDTLTMPYENPFKALMFASGHDFFANGDAAVCTVHGDVWRVSGIDEDLDELRWQRFATGLFHPLGLLVRDDSVFVVGRDQITVLKDLNGDGEADVYENLNNEGHVTGNGHEYVTCLEQDSQGWFYFLKGDSNGMTDHDGSLLRVSPDGEKLEVFATGIRNGNGLGIGPGDVITFSPQEGNWTPASAIFEARQGGFYGMMPAHHRAVAPTTLDPPMCWIPRWLDNSSGGQVWGNSDRFGPLGDGLLHFSFGRCRAMLVLREVVSEQAQGGITPLPLEFLSGVMRGRFREQDGQLYVTGLMGWVSSAVREGCLQRVRYTGRPANLPIAMHAHRNGLAITFSDALDPAAATDVSNYALEQWNYRWSSEYGSPDIRPSDPQRRGHDTVRVRSAQLLDDQRTVFLEIPAIQPVMQMSITYALRAADGAELRSGIYNTIHHLGPPHPAASSLANMANAAEEQEQLEPGLWVQWSSAQASAEDARVLRLASWYAGEGESISSFLPAGAFTARAEGYLQSSLPDQVRFRIRGEGAARLWINGLRVLDVTGDDLAAMRSAPVPLRAGPNRVVIEYASPSKGDAALRLVWSSERFGEEPVPPEVLAHAPSEIPERESMTLRAEGHWLHAQFGCANCHLASNLAGPAANDGVAWRQQGPDLSNVAARLQPDWLVRWIENPAHLRPDTTMPRMLTTGPTAAQQARDLTAYLMTLGPKMNEGRQAPEVDETRVARGEALFSSLACISCHSFSSPEQADPYERTSLYAVASKYRPAALVDYLRQPDQHRPAGSRMPDFQLSAEEAADLAAYVTSQSQGAVLPLDLSDADPLRGAQLFGALRCNQCHSIESMGQARPVASLPPIQADQRTDCLGTNVSEPGIPNYSFSDSQRAALVAYLRDDGMREDRFAPAEYADHMIEWLRCRACHDRDEAASPLAQILAEEGALGRPPEKLPSLTWTGEKLRSEWVARQLAGEVAEKTRPWLTGRMPAFKHFSHGLAVGLASEHGVPPVTSDVTPMLSIAERQLAEGLLEKTGLDCRQCHAPAGELLDNKNEAQGIGLAFMRDRLREDYYFRWMHNPLRIDPMTKMPQFSLDGRYTQARHLAGGDAERQFRAIWNYLHADPALDSPAGTKNERALPPQPTSNKP